MTSKHSTVVAYLALFIALGGTSYAGVKLSKGSVTTREIRDRSIRTVDLAPSARALSTEKLRSEITQVVSDPATGLNITLHAQDGDPGPKGDIGPGGAKGEAGPQGATGANGADGGQGPQGQAGWPAIAAHIGIDGDVLWSSYGNVQSKRIGDYYCLRITTGGLSSASVTLDDVGTYYTDQPFVSVATASRCPGYALAVLVIRTIGTGSEVASHPFYVTLD